MAKRVNADDCTGLERNSRFHFLRLLLAGLAIWLGIEWYNSTEEQKIKQNRRENISTYTTLTEALSRELPRYEYKSVKILDEAGPVDPTTINDTFIGYVNDNAIIILKDNNERGYILNGIVYNPLGRKAGKLLSGNKGYDIYSLDNNKKIGEIIDKKITSIDGAVIGTVGARKAVLVDSMSNITGIINNYDFSRTNK